MKEFDFDELDKAVSNLMGDVPATPSSDATAAEPIQDTPAADNQALSETSDTPTAEVEQVPEQQPSSLPQPSDAPAAPLAAKPPATKRAGRFMDVVHPSSDMKTSSSKPSREGITITPPSTQSSSDELVETPAQPEPEAAAEPEVTETSDISNNETAESEPLTTPFLPDAKVEKRPLGSAGPSLDEQMAHELSGRSDSTSSSVTAQQTPVSTPTVEDKQSIEPTALGENISTTTDDKQQPAKADVAILPPELGEELVAIESGEETLPAPLDTADTKPGPTASNEPVTKPTASSQGSITQQYAEQPSSSDASHAAIFDAATDHSPLTHPKKQHNGWLWVLVVVVLLVIGAVGGSAVYFFELI